MFGFAVGATVSCTWLPCESECFFKFLLYMQILVPQRCHRVLLAWKLANLVACTDCIWNWHFAEARPCNPCIASRPRPRWESRVEQSPSHLDSLTARVWSSHSAFCLVEQTFFVLLLWCFVARCFCFRSAGWYDSVVLASVRRASKPSTGLPNKPYEDNCVTCNSSQQHLAGGLSSTFCPQCHETLGTVQNQWLLERCRGRLIWLLFYSEYFLFPLAGRPNVSQSKLPIPASQIRVTLTLLRSNRANALNANRDLSGVWKIGRVRCSSSPLSPLSMQYFFHFEDCHLDRLSS